MKNDTTAPQELKCSVNRRMALSAGRSGDGWWLMMRGDASAVRLSLSLSLFLDADQSLHCGGQQTTHQ